MIISEIIKINFTQNHNLDKKRPILSPYPCISIPIPTRVLYHNMGIYAHKFAYSNYFFRLLITDSNRVARRS